MTRKTRITLVIGILLMIGCSSTLTREEAQLIYDRQLKTCDGKFAGCSIGSSSILNDCRPKHSACYAAAQKTLDDNIAAIIAREAKELAQEQASK